MCSLIYKLKFRSDVSNIIFTRNYIFHFGNEYTLKNRVDPVGRPAVQIIGF